MNLIFNAESLRPPITGVGNYSYHMLSQLVNGSLVDDVHCFNGTAWVSGEEQLAATAALIAGGGQAAGGFKTAAIEQVRTAVGAVPGTKRLYAALMDGRFKRTADSIERAVYHETNYILKPYSGPCVTTVHDLSHLRFPQFHHEHVLEWLAPLAQTLERADKVITVSDVVRNELIEQFALPPEKIRTVYEGVDENYVPRSKEQTSAVLDEYGLNHGKYVLLVATLEPRKGIDVLLDAWALLPEELRREYPLVLAGSTGWRNKALKERIEVLVDEGTVRHLGYVPAEVLPPLFAGAAVFVYPSVYEGFGLPVLDAMSSGVPVICRAGTSMAEFSEGSCLLFEEGEEELGLKLQALLASSAEREMWAGKGLAQASHFSWQRCAAETARIYGEVS